MAVPLASKFGVELGHRGGERGAWDALRSPGRLLWLAFTPLSW